MCPEMLHKNSCSAGVLQFMLACTQCLPVLALLALNNAEWQQRRDDGIQANIFRPVDVA
jgi:hypothetical protein